MVEPIDLTRTAQLLLARIAQDQLQGQMQHDLPALGVEHGSGLPDLHKDIDELTKGRVLLMERLGGSDSGTAVRFHLSAEPSLILSTLCKGGA